jgi:tryptophan synthase beta chain
MVMTEPARVGYFGDYGGQFVPETVTGALRELEAAFRSLSVDPSFVEELASLHREYTGRPTPLFLARRMSADLGRRVYLKREDLCHTGSHKLNNALAQVLLAKRMGKQRIIAETGAGQHGVATATACALCDLPCEVYMGSEDVRRQALNVYRMELMGSRVIPVESGSRTLKDAINEAFRDWVTNVETTHYVIGSVVGPHPYPLLVRHFQAAIGQEARAQILEREGRLPDAVVACVGGGSNAMGVFHAFVPDKGVRLIGVEAAGRGLATGAHAASLAAGEPGILHGARTYLMQDAHGQVLETHSVSAGLDYPAVGPEHAYLRDSGRAEYVGATDEEALEAFAYLSRMEGIIPALESAHAVAAVRTLAPELPEGGIVVVNLSGRGDKDVVEVARLAGRDLISQGEVR